MGPGNVLKISPDGKHEDWLTGLLMPVGLAIKAGNLYVGQYASRAVEAFRLSDKSAQMSLASDGNPQYFTLTSPETQE